MEAMTKLLPVLMMMVVANPTLAADNGIMLPKTLRIPIEKELTFEGRFVRVIVPANLHHSDRRLLPLVLHLHGAVPFPDVADLELDNSGYRDLPGRFKVIVAAPTATIHPVLSLFHWNITEECCAFPPGTEPDDVGFLNRLLDELLASYPVDPRRVYLYGYSAGAAMAYRLACDSTDRFAAIVAGAGQFPVHDPGRCAPSAPISILEVHSLDDEAIPFDGGTFPLNPALEFPGSIELVEYWADVNGCKGNLKFGKKPSTIRRSPLGSVRMGSRRWRKRRGNS